MINAGGIKLTVMRVHVHSLLDFPANALLYCLICALFFLINFYFMSYKHTGHSMKFLKNGRDGQTS